MKQAVLLVDDEQSVRSALRRTLRSKNYDVYEAESGQQALQLLETQKVNVVLSDQRMPGMSGTQLLKIIKNKHPSIKRIMVSGHSDIDDLNQAINEANIFRFIQKPWSNENLSAIVAEAVSPVSTSTVATPPTPAPALKSAQELAAALQKAIRNDELTLDFSPLRNIDESHANIDISNIYWKQHSMLQHKDIITTAYNAGFLRDLYTWYLLKNIDEYNRSNKKYRRTIIDIFHTKPTEKNHLHKLFSASLKQGYNFILKISPLALHSPQLNDLLIETYNTNTKLLLHIDNEHLPIKRLENIPISYIEMNGDNLPSTDSDKTEARLKIINEAHNLSIKTILTNVCKERQLLYAKTMNFDFFSTK